MSESAAAAEKKKRKRRSRPEKNTDPSSLPTPERSKGGDKSPGLTSQSRRRQARAEARVAVEFEAGPGPSTSANRDRAAATTNAAKTTFGDDFVAFSLQEEDTGDLEEWGDDANTINTRRDDRDGGRRDDERREGERGRGRDRDRGREDAGKKRKAPEFDPDDGYQSKKQRQDAASRKAPWIGMMDAEGCTNVAELYVPLSLLTMIFLYIVI